MVLSSSVGPLHDCRTAHNPFSGGRLAHIWVEILDKGSLAPRTCVFMLAMECADSLGMSIDATHK